MKIIDFHTHPFISPENNSCFYKDIVSSDNFRKIVEAAGIFHICGSVIYRTECFEEIKKLNREALELKEKWGDFYTPGIHIHPHFADESIQELDFMYRNGVRIVGELVPYYNGWSVYYDKNLHKIYEEIERLGMLVSVHTDMNVDMDNLEEAVKRFKNINFVAAHPHQKEHYYKHIELLKKYDNYYLDLSGTGLFRFGMLRTLINNAGFEKILFATDFPISNPKMYVEAVLFEGLNEKELEAVLYKNAERLIKSVE